MRPSADRRPTPLAGQWVILHRVGSDRAGPMDSVQSGADGRYRFRYAPFGAADALYFVSSTYRGIAYFSPPLRERTVRAGGDADVIVYDTTSDTVGLRVQGRHFVLSSPRGARREVAEIFELENDGTHTVVPRDSMTPIWSTPIPAEAESIAVPQGDVSAGAVTFRPGRAEVYAPISPGVRQLVMTYTLPVDAFPVTQPVGRKTSLLEVLLEEPRASVEGANLDEVPPAPIDGRTFRRFLAQDVPASAVIRVSAPRPVDPKQSEMRVLAIVMALAMAGAFAFWAARTRAARAQTAQTAPPKTVVDVLITELASLDMRFERETAPTAETRANYERERARLKERIADALAGEKTPA